jgi:protein-S-isoprenylcysteine O-methyltransferase
VNSLYIYLANFFWCVIFVIWAAAHFKTKPTVRRPDKGRYLGTTALLIASFFLLFGEYPGWLGLSVFAPGTAVLGVLGVVFCVAGAGMAVWARITLGSNWSGWTATIKQGHELVQRGPYGLVRHPIYTGFLFAMVGTALAVDLCASYLGVLFGLAAFLVRIPTEERLLTEEFPGAFSTYKARVKCLIPFVW